MRAALPAREDIRESDLCVVKFGYQFFVISKNPDINGILVVNRDEGRSVPELLNRGQHIL